jgi:hypothetical protein
LFKKINGDLVPFHNIFKIQALFLNSFFRLVQSLKHDPEKNRGVNTKVSLLEVRFLHAVVGAQCIAPQSVPDFVDGQAGANFLPRREGAGLWGPSLFSGSPAGAKG